MRYSTEPKYIKYVKGHGFFCHLQENLVINVKNLWILQQKQE